MDPLTEVLRAEPPAAVRALPTEVRARLAEQVVAARRASAALNKQAVDQAVSGVPLPLRGIIKKTLGV